MRMQKYVVHAECAYADENLIHIIHIQGVFSTASALPPKKLK